MVLALFGSHSNCICFHAQVKVNESILSSEMLSTLPKKLPDWLLVKLDTELVPLKYGEAEINVDFDAKLLFDVLNDKMGMATVSALREAAKSAPVLLDELFKRVILGLLKVNVIAGSGAMVNLDFGGVLPLFQLLPCKEGSGEAGAAQDDDWE